MRARLLLILALIFLIPVGFLWIKFPDSPHTIEATIAGIVGFIVVGLVAAFGRAAIIGVALLVVAVLVAGWWFRQNGYGSPVQEPKAEPEIASEE
jgi:carbon starvation protein CstA